MASELKNKTISGLFWKFGEKISAQFVTFVVSIVLARILDPKHYGAIALITVFITIANVFVDSGLGSALIQKVNADETDFSTVFFFNIGFSIVLYIIIFFSAPFVSEFYEMPELCKALRILGVSVIVYGVKSVQQAYVARNMIFKKFFLATIIGTIFSAVIGIVMACYGFGIMSLVAQYLSNAAIDTLMLWITVKWRPKAVFSFQKLKGLFAFGWRILVSSLIDTVYTNVRQLIIGKLYSSANLAYYNKGKSFPVLIVDNVNTTIDNVLFPAMSSIQKDSLRLKEITRRSIKTSSYIMCPMMFGLAICARPLVVILLTEKWIESVFFLQIFALTYLFRPIHTANLNAIKAKGRSDIYLKLEIIKKILGLIVLVSTMWFGTKVMACSLLFSTAINSFINAYPNKKLLNYSYFEQLKDLLPNFGAAIVMCIPAYIVLLLNLNMYLTLVLQVILSVVTYVGISSLFKMESFIYILNTFGEKIPKKIFNVIAKVLIRK